MAAIKRISRPSVVGIWSNSTIFLVGMNTGKLSWEKCLEFLEYLNFLFHRITPFHYLVSMPGNKNICPHHNLYINVHSNFVMAKNQQQINNSLITKWIKSWYAHRVDCYSVINRKNMFLIHISMWLNLEISMLN